MVTSTPPPQINSKGMEKPYPKEKTFKFLFIFP